MHEKVVQFNKLHHLKKYQGHCLKGQGHRNIQNIEIVITQKLCDFYNMLLLGICSKCPEDRLYEISRSSDGRSRSQPTLKFFKTFKILITQNL